MRTKRKCSNSMDNGRVARKTARLAEIIGHILPNTHSGKLVFLRCRFLQLSSKFQLVPLHGSSPALRYSFVCLILFLETLWLQLALHEGSVGMPNGDCTGPRSNLCPRCRLLRTSPSPQAVLRPQDQRHLYSPESLVTVFGPAPPLSVLYRQQYAVHLLSFRHSAPCGRRPGPGGLRFPGASPRQWPLLRRHWSPPRRLRKRDWKIVPPGMQRQQGGRLRVLPQWNYSC